MDAAGPSGVQKEFRVPALGLDTVDREKLASSVDWAGVNNWNELLRLSISSLLRWHSGTNAEHNLRFARASFRDLQLPSANLPRQSI